MGYEYSSRVQAETEPLNWRRLIGCLEATQSVTLAQCSKGQAALCFAGRNHAENPWGEDARLSLDENELYIVFHGATREERQTVLRELENSLGEHGYRLSWEEL